MRDCLIFVGAEDQADRRILFGVRPVLARVIEIEVHLSGVGVRELAELQVDYDQATKTSMKEEQIDAVPFITDAQPTLAADECEVAAQFHQEVLQLVDKRLFQVAFRILILEVEKLQDERILDRFFRRHRIGRRRFRTLPQHGALVLRQQGPFVEERIDLAIELPDAPAPAQGLRFVELARLEFLDLEQANLVGPGKGQAFC